MNKRDENRTNNSDASIAPFLVFVIVVLFWVIFSLRADAAAPVPPALPDPKLTPGVAGTLTSAQLCARGFTTRSIRDVTEDEKAAVYARYGVKDHQGAFANCPRGAEVDHLISLEIGGLNDIKNLWPESYCGPQNATVKDRLENRLHELVCAGKIELAGAQKCISVNWLDCYAKWVPVSAVPTKHAVAHRARVKHHVSIKRHSSSRHLAR